MSLPQRAVIESILIGVVSTLLVILIGLVPVLNIAVLLWPVPLIVVGVRRGYFAGLLSLIVSGMLIGFLFQPLTGIILVVTNLFLVIGLSFGLRKRLDLFENILISAGSVLLSIMLFLKAYSFIAGQSAFDVLWQFTREAITNGGVDFNKLLLMYHEMGLFNNFTTAAQLAEFLIGQMQLIIPAAIIIISLVYGMVIFIVSRLIVKRFGYEVIPIPAFADWVMPKGMGSGFLALLLVTFLGSGLEIANFEVVQLTVTSLILLIFTVQGLAVLWFFLKAGRVPSVIRWLLVIFIYFVINMLLTYNIGLAILGIFDHTFGLRRNYRNKFIMRK